MNYAGDLSHCRQRRHSREGAVGKKHVLRSEQIPRVIFIMFPLQDSFGEHLYKLLKWLCFLVQGFNVYKCVLKDT